MPDAAEDVRQRDQQDRRVDRRHQHPERRVRQRHPLVLELPHPHPPPLSTLDVNVNLAGRIGAMAVWTIAAQEGTGGDEIAAELAARAERAAARPALPRVLRARARPGPPSGRGLRRIEERVGGLRVMLASSLAMSTGAASAAALEELQLRHRLPDLGRAVVAEAARRPCVILAPAAFAALAEHPGAIHVRLRAPFPVPGRRLSARAPRRPQPSRESGEARRPREKRMGSLALPRRDRRPRLFTLVVDASRLSTDRLADTLLAAAGVQARLQTV